MKWKRISDSKEKNKSLNKENTNILKDKLNNLYKSIKQTLKNVFKNEKTKENENTKASFYLIKVERKLNKTKVILVSAVLISVLILVIGTVSMIYADNKRDKEIDVRREQIEKEMQEEEQKKAIIEAEKEAQRQAKLPKLTNQGVENMQKIYNSDKKRVFFTFDDGPSTNTEPILNILQQEGIKATFFELGSRVEVQPELVKRAYDEGHYIASHGYSHVYSQIYSSPQAVLDEYNQCVQAIRNAIGESEYNPHLFRFPGGLPGGPYVDVKTEAQKLLIQNEILNIDWNALSGDAEGNNLPIEKLMARTDETVAGKNSIVLLMHDAQAKTTTVQALPQIIAYFRDRGYEFENFYEIIK